jgi:predicted RNase H-like HicB family nuclease
VIREKGFGSYYWCIDAHEVSTDLMWRRRSGLHGVLDDVFDYAIRAFSADDAVRFLGLKRRPRTGDLETRDADVPRGAVSSTASARTGSSSTTSGACCAMGRGVGHMTNEFTAVVERDGEWFIAYCAEIPGANGQGRTKEEALESLSGAVTLILEDRREDALRGLPADAIREKVTVK